MIRRPPRSTLDRSSAASDVYKRQPWKGLFSGLLKAANFEDCNDVSESFDAGIPFSGREWQIDSWSAEPVSYTHLRAHETVLDLVCRLLLEKKKKKTKKQKKENSIIIHDILALRL